MIAKDDFDRDCYCLVGLPIDAVNLTLTMSLIEDAINDRKRLFLTTPNLNFVISCATDSQFRDSVINSDLVVADGVSLLILAKMMGVPVTKRVAGSTIFESLFDNLNIAGKRSVYFFGGAEGVAHKAMNAVNATSKGLICVGARYPGFKSVDEMSNNDFIDHINSFRPDFLVVSLGAKKGQAWIEANLERLNVSVVSHLGAVVNFAAGTIKRAPVIIQKLGLEWLWRIKEEPVLWRRYFYDGIALLQLMIFKIMPLMIFTFWTKVFHRNQFSELVLEQNEDFIKLHLKGIFALRATEENRAIFRLIANGNKLVYIDCKDLIYLGPSFLALFLMLNKHLRRQGKEIIFINVSKKINWILKLNAMEYLVVSN